ncbi:MAG: hypothetical protein AB4042_05030 [Leptolyngbyaceae cyanobacterium]
MPTLKAIALLISGNARSAIAPNTPKARSPTTTPEGGSPQIRFWLKLNSIVQSFGGAIAILNVRGTILICSLYLSQINLKPQKILNVT